MPPPNLLFLYTDEQAFNTLGAYGNDLIEMPNLNRLAEQSVVFDRAYVTQPVCTPSRATLLTGLYPHTSGCTANNIPLGAGTPCLPEMLPAGEYATAHYGKWHLGDEIFAQHGFEEWRSIEDMYRGCYSEGRDRDAKCSYHHFLVEHGFRPRNGDTFGRGEAARLPERFGKPAFLAREASDFIRRNRERPFILYVNFLEPHMPFFGPRDGQYDPSQVPLPANFREPPLGDQPLKTRALRQAYRQDGHSGLPLKTDDNWRRIIANYWGLCSLVDTHAGAILDTLDECGLRDSTVVVFTSDHGDMMGAHGLLAKCVMFEEAVRVPMMIRLPGQREGRRVPAPVSQVDVVPTLLDLLGRPAPGHLEGESLRPLMEGRGEPRHAEDVFIEWNGPDCGSLGEGQAGFRVPAGMAQDVTPEELAAHATDPVRTVITPDGWKFNCSPLGEHELYNLRDDPHETINLARDGDQLPRMRELLERIRAWQQRTGDKVRLPDIPAGEP